MINTKEKLNDAINSGSIVKVRVFLDNCLLWDALNKREIEEYVEILSNKTINGKYIFEKDNNIDLSIYKNTQEDLDKLYAESSLNYSKEKYLHRLKIANELLRSDSNNKNVFISHKSSNKHVDSKLQIKESSTNGKKKLALALILLVAGWIVIYQIIMHK